jgi:hypothetical protein
MIFIGTIQISLGHSGGVTNLGGFAKWNHPAGKTSIEGASSKPNLEKDRTGHKPNYETKPLTLFYSSVL